MSRQLELDLTDEDVQFFTINASHIEEVQSLTKDLLTTYEVSPTVPSLMSLSSICDVILHKRGIPYADFKRALESPPEHVSKLKLALAVAKIEEVANEYIDRVLTPHDHASISEQIELADKINERISEDGWFVQPLLSGVFAVLPPANGDKFDDRIDHCTRFSTVLLAIPEYINEEVDDEIATESP